ncbi:MAG: thermostable hemolysin [Nitrosomonadales bacterium]|nr:thermostable hemolysin [Nitrosomonadales bacterium]
MLLETITATSAQFGESSTATKLLIGPRSYGPVDMGHRYFAKQPTKRRHQAQVHLHSAENVHTSISDIHAVDRQELESFVHGIFHQAYGADVKEFMPELMSLRNDQGELLAVCGLRHAENASLFLERYLQQPVEQIIAAKTGQSVHRGDIVEIGNLAVAHPETVRSLLASISVYLHGTQTAWGVFTGIPTLRNALSKLNMLLLPLGVASLSHLPAHEHAAWGRYYDEKPHVMAVQRLLPPKSTI